MQHLSNNAHLAAPKIPWNKGKLTGAKPPLQTKHVWPIRTKLQMDGKNRDLAMFNLRRLSRHLDALRYRLRQISQSLPHRRIRDAVVGAHELQRLASHHRIFLLVDLRELLRAQEL
jgi:hypothetical protein